MSDPSTLKNFCAWCNKKFTNRLRRTKKFVVNNGGTEDSSDEGEPPATVDISKGVEEIFSWKYGKDFTGTVDEQAGLCTNCGLSVAKLYTSMKMFEQAKVELSYLNKVVAKVTRKQSKSTDTKEDELHARFEASAVDNSCEVFLEDVNDPEFYSTEGPKRKEPRDNSDKEFRCAHCPAGFDKQPNLTRHLLLSHEIGDREKEFRCDVCGKEFYFSYLLKNHEDVHSEERPFTCTFPNCSVRFKSKAGRRAHIKICHRPDRPFKCRFCPKDFKDHRNWKTHESYVHTIPKSIKPFRCAVCGKRFRRKNGYLLHIQKTCPKNQARVEQQKEHEIENETAVLSILGNDMEVASEVIVTIT